MTKEIVAILPMSEESVAQIESDVTRIKSTRGGGTLTEDGVDGSGAVRADLTIKYSSEASVGTLNQIKLLSVEGGYINSDRSVRVESQSVKYAQNGWSKTANKRITNQIIDANVYSSFFKFTPPSNWYTVEDTDGLTVGATYRIEMSRGTDPRTWMLEITNNL